jgi:hypothetical protein
MQGSEWKEKTEKLETELQQCYKAQSRLSELKIAVHKCLMEACRVIAALNRNLLRVFD